MKLLFKCPFCKKEVQDNDDVILGEETDINKCDSESETTKVFIHRECFENESKK